MHDLFADWYKAVDIDPNPDTIKLHWNAAVSIADDSDPREALGVAAFLLGLPGAEPAQERLQSATKEEDVTFSVRGDQALLNVIAAGALSHMMSSNSEVADAAALAIVCGTTGGKGAAGAMPSIVADIASEADALLHKRALDTRRVGPSPDDSETKLTRFNSGLKDTQTLAGRTAPADLATAWTTLGKRDTEIQAAVDKVVGDLNKTVGRVNQRLEAVERAYGSPAVKTLEEETSILWWLFAEHSNDLDRPLGDLERGVRAFVVGKEMADHTRFVPGHAAARAILSRALGPAEARDSAEDSESKEEEPLDLLAGARALPDEWARSWMPDAPDVPLGLVPVHTAVAFGHLYSEAEQAKQFEAKTGMGEAPHMTPLHTAYQIYNEVLLLRLV